MPCAIDFTGCVERVVLSRLEETAGGHGKVIYDLRQYIVAVIHGWAFVDYLTPDRNIC